MGFDYFAPDPEVTEKYPYHFSWSFMQGQQTSPKVRWLKHKEVYQWCTEQFGVDSERWIGKHSNVFLFRDLADAMHFRLRWC